MFTSLGLVWPMIKSAIEYSIRKVTCTIFWQHGEVKEELKLETYWTEPKNLTKVPDFGGEFTDEDDGSKDGGGKPGGGGGSTSRPSGPGGAAGSRPSSAGPTGMAKTK
jgi:hypothetical protein